ncbi:helix-turn-helix domain-containing protein [Actinoalloteichus sp. AHMU CJ021]|uniref:helix-turn-helix domain-containing protein n=1 Tax=Actinoalloteichus sp. AHMU CJ021 TaxID=2072503 RepID=UPI00307B3178
MLEARDEQGEVSWAVPPPRRTMMDNTEHLGRRIRALRHARGMSQQVLADLSGFTKSYLSHIETGTRPVERRSTLEALAAALRVAPSEISGPLAWSAPDPVAAEARAVTEDLAAVLADHRVGDVPDRPVRPWGEVAADVRRLNSDLRPRADYAAQGYLLPRLVEELLVTAGRASSPHRTDALVALADCYHAAAVIAKNTGVRPLAWVAADRLMGVAERLGRPEHTAHALWVRTHMIGGVGRERQIRQAGRWLDLLADEMSDHRVAQAAGQLHLTAAFAHATLADARGAADHLHEAEVVANRLSSDAGRFGYLWFGRTNVTFWRVSIAAELGEHTLVERLAEGVDPGTLPDRGRQAQFYSDYGRSLVRAGRTRERGVRVLRRAEELAPQLTRNNPLVREAVRFVLGRRLAEPAAREARGMAHRMGVAA